MVRSRDGLAGLFIIILILLIVLVAAYILVGVQSPGSIRTSVTYVPLTSQTIEIPSATENLFAENRLLKNKIASLEQERASLKNSLEVSRLEAQRLRSSDDRFRFRFDCDDDCEEEIEDLEDEIDDLEDTIDELCEELDDEGVDSDEC